MSSEMTTEAIFTTLRNNLITPCKKKKDSLTTEAILRIKIKVILT